MKNLKKKAIILAFVLMIWAICLAVFTPSKKPETLPEDDFIVSNEDLNFTISDSLTKFLSKEKEEIIKAETTYKNLNTISDNGYLTPYLVLYDATNKRVLFDLNGDEVCYPASTTKILTACVAAQYCDEDTIFTVGDELNLVAWDSSRAYLLEGQQISFPILLDALMLPSGNDAAYVMAAGVGRIYAGDENLPYQEAVDIFLKLMNQTAKKIGALDSHFTCPDGYHCDDHYVTAMDMAKIAVYASEFECVRNAYSKFEEEYTLDNGDYFYWENTNPLINPYSASYYEYATGLKTGYTDEAGCCLVATAEKDGTKLVAVALRSPSNGQRNIELTELFERGFALVEEYK